MILLRALACWYVARLLVTEVGPGRVFVRLREWSGVNHTADDQIDSFQPASNDWTPLSCVYCTILWISPLIALAPAWLVTMLSSAGLASLLQDHLPER